MSAAVTRVWAIQEIANPRRACDASRMTTFGAVSAVGSTAIRFLVSRFRETKAYIQAPEKQSLVEDSSLEGHLSISARQRSLAADDFRSTPINRHSQSPLPCLKGANAQSRCAPARCAGARAERPEASCEESAGGRESPRPRSRRGQP